MRVLLQRVSRADVTVDDETVGAIDDGLLALVAAGEDDGEADLDYCIDKTAHLRIFEGPEGKMNRSVLEVGGAVLVVPQFTLYAEVDEGRRPSFFEAMDPGPAEEACHRYAEGLREAGIDDVQEGVFGAAMDVELVNRGPVTIWLDSRQ
jgi:D-tyrosyl-tRNA(Tyr) deacylase